MASKETPSFNPEPLPQHLSRLIEMAALTQPDNPTGMRVKLHPGERTEAREVITLGDNAAGKSLMRQLAFSDYQRSAKAANRHFEGIHISMATRAGGGMRASFMYGPWTDSEQSTGVMSLGPLSAAFNTAGSRDHAVALCLDEMELGLNARFHFALGQRIVQLHREHTEGKEHFLGLMVVTHSKELVQGYIAELGYRPAALMFGSKRDMSVHEWLDEPLKRASLDELIALPGLARETRRNFSEHLTGGK